MIPLTRFTDTTPRDRACTACTKPLPAGTTVVVVSNMCYCSDLCSDRAGTYYPAFVAIEDGPAFACYLPFGLDWNGWELPAFTLDEAKAMVARYSGGDLTITYDPEKDAFVMIEASYVNDEGYEPTVIPAERIEGIETPVYDFSPIGWVWSKVDVIYHPACVDGYDSQGFIIKDEAITMAKVLNLDEVWMCVPDSSEPNSSWPESSARVVWKEGEDLVSTFLPAFNRP